MREHKFVEHDVEKVKAFFPTQEKRSRELFSRCVRTIEIMALKKAFEDAENFFDDNEIFFSDDVRRYFGETLRPIRMIWSGVYSELVSTHIDYQKQLVLSDEARLKCDALLESIRKEIQL